MVQPKSRSLFLVTPAPRLRANVVVSPPYTYLHVGRHVPDVLCEWLALTRIQTQVRFAIRGPVQLDRINLMARFKVPAIMIRSESD